MLAVGLIGYFGYKRYAAGENGWKVLGIAVGTFAGISAVQYLGVRYKPPPLDSLHLLFTDFVVETNFDSAFKAWKVKKAKSS